MAIVGVDLTATNRFVSESDPAGPDSQEATVFILGTLDSTLMAHIDDKLTTFSPGEADTGEAIAKINMNEAAIYCARFAINEWHNFLDANGSEIKRVTKSVNVGGKQYHAVTPDCINRVQLSVLVEIYNKVKSQNTLSKDEAGNSDAPSLH